MNLICKNCNAVVGTISDAGIPTDVQGVCKNCKGNFINCGAIVGIEDMTPSQARQAREDACAAVRTKVGD